MSVRFVKWLLLVVCLTASAVWAQEATPEMTSEASSMLFETETFTSDDGMLTLRYPEGWTMRTSGSTDYYFANSDAALEHSFGSAFKSGEVQIGVFTGTLDDIFPDVEFDEDANVLEILTTAIELVQQDTDTVFADPTIETINDMPAASVEASFEGADGIAIVIEFANDSYVALQAITAPGELDQWRDVTWAIAGSITFGAGAEDVSLTETWVSDDGVLTLNYPEGWAVIPGFPNGVNIGSSEAALDLWLNDSFSSGDVHIFVGFGPAAEMFEDVLDSTMSAEEIMQTALDVESEDPDTTVSEVETLTINGLPAAAVRAYRDDAEIYTVAIEYGDGNFATAQAKTAPGELEQTVVILSAILETVEVDPS